MNVKFRGGVEIITSKRILSQERVSSTRLNLALIDNTEVSVRGDCNLADGSSWRLMKYIIAQMVLQSTISQLLLRDPSV